MFKAVDFQYDGKSSTDFFLKIVNFSGGSDKTDSIGFPIEIEDEKIKRIDKPFFYGVEITPKLSFKLQIAYLPPDNQQELITRQTMGTITKWLCQTTYRELKVIDIDYSNMIYNCMIMNPRQIEIGNVPYGLEFDVICDRPYAIYRQTITKTITGASSFIIKNIGFGNRNILPEVEFTLTGAGTDISIVNNSDGGRTFTFTGLSAGETVYVNNQREEIKSSTNLNRNTNFNFNWFRIVPAYNNQINVNGSCIVTFRIEFPMPM